MFYVCIQKVRRTAVIIVTLWETTVVTFVLCYLPFPDRNTRQTQQVKWVCPKPNRTGCDSHRRWQAYSKSGIPDDAEALQHSLVLDCITSCKDCKTADKTTICSYLCTITTQSCRQGLQPGLSLDTETMHGML